MTVFKVCSIDEKGNFRSSNYNLLNDELRQSSESFLFTYEIGKTVEAKIGGILVFTNPLRAELWANENFFEVPTKSFAILECEAEDEVDLVYRLPIHLLNEEGAKRVWVFETARDTPTFFHRWPRSTKAYKRVTPTKVRLTVTYDHNSRRTRMGLGIIQAGSAAQCRLNNSLP